MSDYDDAGKLQSMTRNDEINHPQEYHPIQVRQAVVHGSKVDYSGPQKQDNRLRYTLL